MNRIILFAIALMVCVGAAGAPKAAADIMMNNGTEYKSVPLDKIPEGWDKEIKVVVNGKKVKLAADSIDHAVIWHNDNPDDRCLIKWLPSGTFNMKDGSTKQTMEKGKPFMKWFAFRTAGEHLRLWISFSKLKPSKNRFVLEVNPVTNFFEKKGYPYLIGVPRNEFKPNLTRNWLSAFLADDKVLVSEMSQEKELNRNFLQQQVIDSPAVFDHITKTYTPGRTE